MSCKTDNITIGGGDWSDVKLSCPDNRPWARNQGIVDADGPMQIWASYDNGPADAGRFWLRVSNTSPAWWVTYNYKIAYSCS